MEVQAMSQLVRLNGTVNDKYFSLHTGKMVYFIKASLIPDWVKIFFEPKIGEIRYSTYFEAKLQEDFLRNDPKWGPEYTLTNIEFIKFSHYLSNEDMINDPLKR